MGGGGSSTTTQEIDPMVKPFVEFGLNEARKLYEKGMPAYFPGKTYAGPSDYTTSALDMIAKRAMSGSPLVSSAQDVVKSVTGYGAPNLGMFTDIYGSAREQPGVKMYTDIYGRAQGEGPALGLYRDVYSKAENMPTTGMFTDIYGRAGQVSPDATAAGKYLGMNPFLQGTFEAAARPITQEFQKAVSGIQSAASKAGRYGSGAQAQLETGAAEALASNLAGLGEKLGFSGYAAERKFQEDAINRELADRRQAINQQIAAATGVGTAGGQELSTKIAAATGIGTTDAQKLASLLSAAGGVAGSSNEALRTMLSSALGLTGAERDAASIRLAAAGLAPTLSSVDFMDAVKLLGAGKELEGYKTEEIKSDMDRYQYEAMSPYSSLQAFLSSVYGAPMGSVTSRPYTGNPLLGALGGAASAASLGPLIGMTGGAALPLAVAGGLLGGFGSR